MLVMDKKRKISIVLNVLIVVLEIFALSEILFRYLPNDKPFLWYASLTYYTNLSNIFLLITSTIFLVCQITNCEKNIYMRLRYASIVSVFVTFTTVYFFIVVTGNINLGFVVKENMWLFTHTICPVMALVSFIFFERKERINIKDIIYPILFTICYTVLIEVIYLCDGRVPYVSDFSEEPLDINTFWILLIAFIETIVTFLLALLVRFIDKKTNKKKEVSNE